MIESNDWRLEAGPIGPHKERLMNIPIYQIDLSRSLKNKIMCIVHSVGKSSANTMHSYIGDIVQHRKKPLLILDLSRMLSDFKDLFNWRIEDLT